MNFDMAQVNWLAVLVAGVAAFVVGGVWYGALFAKAWMNIHSYSADDPKFKKGVAMTYGGWFVLELIMALVIAILAINLSIADIGAGAMLGGALWIGVAVPFQLSDHLAHKRPMQAGIIDIGYSLATLVVIGAIIGVWR